MRIPVLTYHATNIDGNEYLGNDHVAFAEDLRLIDDLGLRVVPLKWVVEQLLGRTRRDLDGVVALSCDDGSVFDYFDIDHPEHGRQTSLFNIMRAFRKERGLEAQPDLHLTSFVIASRQAREVIDRKCLIGRDWMSDRWWRAAAASGLMAIENHSFDHNHEALESPGEDGMARGSFHDVDTPARAEAEIAAAQQWLQDMMAPHRASLFCYPFGHVSEYLRGNWLPMHGPEHGLLAAFGDGAKPIEEYSDRWNLPRYICGWHWKSPDELRTILGDATGRSRGS